LIEVKMLFLLPLDKATDTLFLFLTEQDCNDMRGKRTKFVDHKMLKGKSFKKIVVSLHRNTDEARKVLEQAGYLGKEEGLFTRGPEADKEEQCEGCKGLLHRGSLYAGKCVSCWRETAEHYRLEYLQLLKELP
jgi:hypothetical protein